MNFVVGNMRFLLTLNPPKISNQTFFFNIWDSPTIVHHPKVAILLLFHSQYGWYMRDKKLRYFFQWNGMFQGLKYVYTASQVQKSPEMNVKNNQEGFA